MKLTLFYLTCADQKEADTIATMLLEKHLVACIKMMPTHSKYLWEDKLETASEVFMVMEGEESKFGAIEAEVRKLHSYDTFVLMATEVKYASAGVMQWIKDSVI